MGGGGGGGERAEVNNYNEGRIDKNRGEGYQNFNDKTFLPLFSIQFFSYQMLLIVSALNVCILKKLGNIILIRVFRVFRVLGYFIKLHPISNGNSSF